jgi:apolipoprotein N-acyltransferase
MKRRRYAPLVWFVLGFGIFMFTRMSKIVPTIPVAMLIAPVFILRFARTQPARRGILLTLVGFLLSINIGLWGLFDLDGGAFILIYSIVRSSLLAVLYFLPYMIDRLVYPKFAGRGSASSLMFPIITTALFFLSSLEGPFDGAIQSGKFVYGPMVFQQLLSLFGIWSFIFLTSWFASLLNYAWENSFQWSKIRWASAIFLSMVTLVFLFGVIKISSSDPESSTVKIAAVVLIPEEGEAISLDQAWAEKRVSPFEQSVARIAALTETAALNGAKIVSFQEFAMLIHEEDEQRLREEYQTIARENNVYLSITYAHYAQEGKGENKHLLIDSNGEIQLDYTKRYVSGLAELDLGEAGVYRKGPEILQTLDTPYGRIAISICRDMEFPHYMRQAGKDDVDIMLSPAYEWPKGLVIHSVYMRGIEYGFSLVRPTYNGITIAQDFNGRILSQMDSDATDSGILYADVPTRGVNTLYSQIGDALARICVLGFLGLVILSIVVSIGQKKNERLGSGLSVPSRSIGSVLPAARRRFMWARKGDHQSCE